MQNRNRVKLLLALLVLFALACVCSPTALIEQAAGDALAGVEETFEAEVGVDFEDGLATAEALATQGGDLADLELTAEAAVGDEIEFGDDVETEFPLPEHASTVTIIAGSTNFTTNLTIDEAVEFYRNEFTSAGYAERTLLTVIEEGTVSFVFDGHASGQAIVVQMVDLGELGVNVNIRLEDV